MKHGFKSKHIMIYQLSFRPTDLAVCKQIIVPTSLVVQETLLFVSLLSGEGMYLLVSGNVLRMLSEVTLIKKETSSNDKHEHYITMYTMHTKSIMLLMSDILFFYISGKGCLMLLANILNK